MVLPEKVKKAEVVFKYSLWVPMSGDEWHEVRWSKKDNSFYALWGYVGYPTPKAWGKISKHEALRKLLYYYNKRGTYINTDVASKILGVSPADFAENGDEIIKKLV